MKRCPKCNSTYTDPTLSYCLQDGSPLANEISTRYDQQAETLKMSAAPTPSRASGTRAMIALEIDENLAKLQEFRDTVDNRIKFSTDSLMASVQRSDGLRMEPLPDFSRVYWDKTPTPNLAEALSESELRQVHDFYAQLNEIAKMKKEKKASRPREWREAFEPVLKDILDKGNPLKN